LLLGNLTFNSEAPSAWLGRFLVFLFVFNRLSTPVGTLNTAWLRLIAKVPSYDLFTSFVAGLRQHRRERGSLGFDRLRSGIRFDDVTFAYSNVAGAPALRGINVSIAKGETIALVGPSGSGKTTFAMLITGLFRPTSGRILIDGIDVDALDWDQWHRRLGFVFQDAFIFDDSVRRNIEFPFAATKFDLIMRAAQEAQADEFIKALPEGYDTRVGIRGERLSGGQRQRVSIARTLLRDADVLILDEAASNLDTLVEAALHRALERHRGEKTIIHIAHRLGAIREVDRILVFDAGALVAEGTHDELLESCGLYAELVAQSAFAESREARIASPDEVVRAGA
jgi:ABC-type multidrug transport system fused ATPase/permease subunit